MPDLSLPPQTMAALLPLLTELDDSKALGHLASISVARVQAWAWAPARLARAAEHLAAGERAPAIHVSRYWLLGEPYYVVADGHHRTVAACQAGHRRIWARIGSESWCKPEECLLDAAHGSLWRKSRQHQGLLRLVSVGELEPELQQALRAVGVNPLVFS